MTFRTFILFMGAGTILAWLGWLFVIFRIDPQEAGIPGLVLFYVTLFVSLIGTFAMLGVYYRVGWLKRRQVMSREVRIAFRHGLMLSFVAVLSLALSAAALLTWWNMLLMIAFIGVVEYGFLLVQESRRS